MTRKIGNLLKILGILLLLTTGSSMLASVATAQVSSGSRRNGLGRHTSNSNGCNYSDRNRYGKCRIASRSCNGSSRSRPDRCRIVSRPCSCNSRNKP